jgi:hypothetical protein
LETLKEADNAIVAVRGYAGQFYRWVIVLRGDEEGEDE